MKKIKNIYCLIITSLIIIFSLSGKDLYANHQVSKNLDYNLRDYITTNGINLGTYPVIPAMQELSNKILLDINSGLLDLNLNNLSDNNNIISCQIEDLDDNYSKIIITLNYNYLSKSFVYYVDKNKNIEITEKDFDNQKLENTELEPETIHMVQLRSNAEQAGWKVEWVQKNMAQSEKNNLRRKISQRLLENSSSDFKPEFTREKNNEKFINRRNLLRGQDQDHSMVLLTKNNYLIKVLIEANFDYDLIINQDINKSIVLTEKLEKPAELKDDRVYVPKSFCEKFLHAN